MINKDAVCFRYKQIDGTIVYCCIQENKIWEERVDDSCVYLDMDDAFIKNLIDTLQSMLTYND